jgi:hypothetical protein
MDQILTVVSAEHVARNLRRVGSPEVRTRAHGDVLGIGAQQTTSQILGVRLELGHGLEAWLARSFVPNFPDVTLPLSSWSVARVDQRTAYKDLVVSGDQKRTIRSQSHRPDRDISRGCLGNRGAVKRERGSVRRQTH